MSGLPRRLHFLDGLRGLACLYVLLFHASTPHIPYGGELSAGMRFLSLCLSRGRFSVVFFIVLSGYSIMLPIARAGDQRINGGLVDFARRRARRILPPYYVALALSAALIVVYNAFTRRHGLEPVVEDALGPGSVLAHLLLVHNATFAWAFRINGPMWSVATEWQIYFVFALVLLPLWRTAGHAVTLVAAWVVGSLPFLLLPPERNFFWACPWFIGSFMLGVWGATIGFSPAYEHSWLRRRAPWQSLAFACFGIIVFLVGSGRADSWGYPIVDFIVSSFAFFLVNACAQHLSAPSEGQRSMLVRGLSSKALVYLGGFSYSLYLIQHPVLRLAEKIVAKVTASRDANIGVHLLVAVPATIALAWLFAEFFERPFTSGGVILPAIRRRVAAAPPGRPSEGA